MERPLTLSALEDAIATHCAAVLLDARPASMFTFVGNFASPRPDDPAHPDCAFQGHGPGDNAHGPSPTAGQRARRALLARLLSACERELAPSGIRARVLAWRPCGAIVYLYRPDRLARSLSDPRTSRALGQMGYRTEPRSPGPFCAALLAQLGARFSCATGLPHEMGFFLGYPYEDVMGFITHRGRDFICFGCWKVYANPRRALRSFSRFKRCARRAERLRSSGATLADLARPATPPVTGPPRGQTIRERTGT